MFINIIVFSHMTTQIWKKHEKKHMYGMAWSMGYGYEFQNCTANRNEERKKRKNSVDWLIVIRYEYTMCQCTHHIDETCFALKKKAKKKLKIITTTLFVYLLKMDQTKEEEEKKMFGDDLRGA